ncbi:MAG: restriction endonuclease subunit S [Rectinemataceae bacterium]|nr:restriction endonuclease subunit S [Rectinemataceae bacterium]
MGEMKEVPSGWETVSLGEIGQIVSGGTPSTAINEYWADEINWISPVDLSGYKRKYISKGAKSISKLGLANSSAKLMPAGSVLFSSRAPIGYVAIAGSELSTNQGFKSIIPFDCIFNEFLFYFLKSAKQQADDLASGTTFKEISLTNFSKMSLSLPPLPEQHRIVANIEELFSSLDKGIESLKTAQAQLKIYRQAVLKWAFEGKLTNDDVKEGELPEGWRWKKIDEVINKLDQGWSPKCENEKSDSNNEWAVIKTTAIQHNLFSDIENKKLPVDLKPRAQHELKNNDILITRAGPRVRVGVCCLVKNVRPKLLNCDKAYRIKIIEGLIYPAYFVHILNSPQFLEIIEKCKSGGSDSGLNLTQNVFLAIEIPLPPTLSEQSRIVAEIESRLSVCDKLEESITQSLLQSEALRQSILKKAFEGKLVPQDPDDEPASVLLARIRADRESVVAKKTTTRAGGVPGRKWI